METRLIEKEEMFFLGMEERFASAEDHDADLVMFRLFLPCAAAFDKYAVDDALYAVGRNAVDGSCTYMVGKRVRKMAGLPGDLPDGAVYRSIPQSLCVEIRTTPRELGEIEQRKIREWFGKHPEYQPHPDAVGVECYPPECRSADGEMWTWYPVVRMQ